MQQGGFARDYAERWTAKIRAGASHPSLGPNLDRGADWWKSGVGTLDLHRQLFEIPTHAKVIDYGCGSLRVGVHYIMYLDSGRYFGLDVTTGFIDMGKEIIGEQLLAQKAPVFFDINELSIKTAASFSSDFIFSNGVAFHVHPDELSEYLTNLRLISNNPDVTLFFDVYISNEPSKFLETCWSWPLETFTQKLEPLELVSDHHLRDRQYQGIDLQLRMLGFRHRSERATTKRRWRSWRSAKIDGGANGAAPPGGLVQD